MQRPQYKEERSSSWVIKYGKVDDDDSFAKIKEGRTKMMITLQKSRKDSAMSAGV